MTNKDKGSASQLSFFDAASGDAQAKPRDGWGIYFIYFALAR